MVSVFIHCYEYDEVNINTPSNSLVNLCCQGLMAGLVSRLILLYWLPIRLATELFHAYVWRPRVKPAAGQNGHLNGNSSHHEFADREVDIVNMNPKKRTELNEAMDKWWGASKFQNMPPS